MAANPELENNFNSAIKTPERVAAARKKIDPVFKDLCAKVPAAIRDGDHKMIEFYLQALRVELNSISASLQDISIGLDQLEFVEDDEDFLADHLAEVEKATKELSDARTALTHQYEAVKALENDAEKGLKSKKVSKDDLFVEVAKYDTWITQDLKQLPQLQDQVDALEDKAETAVKARDAKALADAQKAMRELEVFNTVDLFQDRQNDLKALLKKIDDQKFDAKATAELRDGVNDLIARQLKGAGRIRAMQVSEEHVRGLKIVAIVVKEAMKVLDLDPKDTKLEAKLARVLKGKPADFEKGLGALAKELNLKTTGAAMLAALRKAEVV